MCTAGISRPTFCFCFAAKDAVLNSLNERVPYATCSANGPPVAEDDVVDVLLEVWPRVIQGTAPAD